VLFITQTAEPPAQILPPSKSRLWLWLIPLIVLVGAVIFYFAHHPSKLRALAPSRPASPATTVSPTATNEVNGAFGIVLGDDISSCKALVAEQEKLGVKGIDREEDGGYYIMTFDAEPPFNSLHVQATDQRKIYSIGAMATTEDRSLHENLLKALSEKYPRVSHSSTPPFITDIFGHGDRVVTLEMFVGDHSSVSVNYEDKGLRNDYFSRVKLRKEEELRKQLNKTQL
jgi:hypothetical protein